MAQNTVDDYINWKKTITNKPATPIAPGSLPIYGANGTVIEGTNVAPGTPASGDVDKYGNVIGEKTRTGDYVYNRGRAYLVPNSKTDINLKSIVASGGYKQPTVSGMPNGFSNIVTGASLGSSAGSIAGAAGGAAGVRAGGIIGGVIGGLLGLITESRRSYDEAINEWMNQNVNYDTAVEFYRDEDGKLKYQFDYGKMAEGGELSSSDVLKLQDQKTKVSLGDDGILQVDVSPVFAQSDYFKSILDDISNDYAGLTRTSDNFDQSIKDIEGYIDSARENYIANNVMYAAYKAMFPEASSASIIAGFTTTFAGNADPARMDKYTVYYVSDGEIKETDAKDYFDSVYELDKDQRNTYLKSLMELVSNPDADQNEKAVAYGDLQALYAVSANKYGYKDPDDKNKQSKYQGMLDADAIVTFWAQFQLLDDVFLRNGKQEYLNQNGVAQFTGMLAATAANVYTSVKGMEVAGNIMKSTKWGKALFDASKMGETGQATAFFASQANSVKGLIKVGAAGITFNTARSVMFNTARSGARLLTGDKFEEVAKQFGTDVALDAAIGMFMEFYDSVKFKATVEDTTQFVYRDPKTGNIKILPTDHPGGITYAEGTSGVPETYEKVGSINMAKTSSGTDIGVVKNENTTVYRYGDKFFVIGADGKTAQWGDVVTDVDGNITGFTTSSISSDLPAPMKTGVIEEGGDASQQNLAVRKGLQDAGLPEDTQVFEMPSKDAYSAVAAGKFLKVDSSKVGLKINEQIFNSNAALDYVNNLALARTGNRTAWQNANEVFANTQQLANTIRSDINNGVYKNPITGKSIAEKVKDSREAYVKYREETFVSQFGKMTKEDNLYIKAKESIARAKLAQQDIAEDSGVDLVQEAIDKNGKYIERIPKDRADALDTYVKLNKRYLNDYIMAVKNSGLLDIETLNNVVNSDINRKLGYIPMWGKKETYNNLLNEYFLVDNNKMPVKSWNRSGEVVDVKDIMDFTVSTDYITDMFATNMAHSYTNQILAEQLQDAGMLIDNRRTTASERRKLLMRVENYDEMRKELKNRISETKKYVNENVPTQGQYKEMMEKIYSDSGAETSIKFYKDIESEFKETYEDDDDNWEEIEEEEEEDTLGEISGGVWNEIQKLSSSYMERGVASEDFNRLLELNDEIASNSSFTKQQMADFRQLTNPKIAYKTDHIKDIASMNYQDRLKIAEDVIRNHQREDGLGSEYILLYRVQGGKPDKWRPNNRNTGFPGEFKSYGGQWDGAVWLTADRAWAEDPDERASAGVNSKWNGGRGKKVTDENIVVLPVKRSDILNLNHETNSKQELKDSGLKIVKTRGIDNGLQKSEYILWKDEHPEIFEDGMKLMMDEYNRGLKERTQRELNSTRNMRKVDSLRGEIDVTRKALNDMKKKRVALGHKIATDMIVSDASKSISDVAEYNGKFGRKIDTEAYIGTSLIPSLEEAIKNNDMDRVRSIIANGMVEVAPYTSRSSIMKSKLDSVADEWRKWAEKNVKVSGKAGKTTKKKAVDVVAAEINGKTIDGYEMGVSKQAASKGSTYPFTYYKNGRPYTRYIVADDDSKRMVAEHIVDIITDKKLVERAGVIKNTARAISNTFRLLTTGMDPTRVLPNFSRDTVRSEVTSGSVAFTTRGATSIFNAMIEGSNLSAKEKTAMRAAFENCGNRVGNSTYNSSYGTPKKAEKALRHEYYQNAKANAESKLVKFSYSLKELRYSLAHDKRSILEAPGDFFEGLTRKRMAKSSFVNAWQEAIIQGKDFGDQLKAAEAAATFAGNEFTANFGRKGKTVGEISRYTAYFSTNFANIDGFKRAYINDPRGVSRNFAAFLTAYLFILADTLSNEESRKSYYRLSDYDRANSAVVSLGGGAILTIPMDETLSSLMFPFRRIIETMNGVDPVSFYEFVWGTLTEPLPLDFSGFSEGDYFNFRRGIEKLMSSSTPTVFTSGLEVVTGYDLYHGSSYKVTADDLKWQDIYDPEPGDYTSRGRNSAWLRKIANATGIPQWQLQTAVANFGGNVGQYVLYWMDSLSGATDEEKGGKDFMDAVFKSFLATDYDEASTQFYNVIDDLKQEKNKLLQKIVGLNKKMATASGDELYNLQKEAQKARDDYGILVGDAVGKYLNAYEITGGLSKTQAMQVYYLFKLDDSDSVYQYGSVGDYFNNKASDAAYDEATSMGAAVMDKYFNQSDKPYLDDNGTWRIAPSYSEKAYLNTIYGQGMKYEVDLRNILDGKNNSFKDRRTEMKNLRSKAADAGDWDLYNRITLAYDRELLGRISDYISRNGAGRVLTNTTALDYLEDWIGVPTNWMTNKKGKYVSLGHDASKERAYARPYLKYLFGLDTGLRAPYDENKANLGVIGQ